jgi:predicted DNA-binding transcriptional regulator YafY
MRADRLLAMLMLLQTRGRLTARQLADELEVSTRTVYRDITALSAAGIPVYTEGGPGGGIALIEDYTTDLTGLSAAETQALAMLTIPEPLVRLGVAPNLKAALLKLSVALGTFGRNIEARTRQRIHLDTSGWFQPEEPLSHLETIRQALWDDRLLEITYLGEFNTPLAHRVAPYGLVAKSNVWHLVMAREQALQVVRVARVTDARALAQTFTRPPDFDLADFWRGWCQAYEANRPRFTVRARVAPELARILPRLLEHNQYEVLTSPPSFQPGKWQTTTLTFESFEAARTRLLGFGRAVEVIEPLALRVSISDYARQIMGLYAPGEQQITASVSQPA